MNTISAINKISFKGNTLNNNQTKVQAQTPAPEIKSDTVELSTKNKTGLIDKIKANKKVLIPVAIGLAAIAGGLIFAIKTGKISFKGKIEQQANEILSESEKIKQRASEIAEEGQKQYNEVLAILQKAKEEGFADTVDESGNAIRKFFNISADRKIMHELNGNEVARRTIFNPDDVEEIYSISKGLKINSGGKIESCAEEFSYFKGKLKLFIKDYVIDADGTEKWAEEFGYFRSKLKSYFENNVRKTDKTNKFAKNFHYSFEGELVSFTKDYTTNAGKAANLAEEYNYSDGKLSSFVKDYVRDEDGTEKWAKKFTRNEKGKLVKVAPQTEQ